MKGYRETLNIPYSPPGANNSSNETGSCNSDDDVETAAILVTSSQAQFAHQCNILCVLKGLIVSLFPVGSLVGAFAAGFVSDGLGRKPAVVLGGGLAAFGGLLHASAIALWLVLKSRVVK